MKVKQCDLKYIGTNFSHYPMDGKPEIAFAGKSNVGKSTLINAILGRKALARTSSQPGKTRTINFYGVNDMMYVVDLPLWLCQGTEIRGGKMGADDGRVSDTQRGAARDYPAD